MMPAATGKQPVLWIVVDYLRINGAAATTIDVMKMTPKQIPPIARASHRIGGWLFYNGEEN